MAEEKRTVPDFVLPMPSSERSRQETAQPEQEKRTVPDFVLPNEKPEPKSVAQDIAASAPAALARGVVGVPGLMGDIQSLYQLGVSKAMPYITGEKSEDVYKRLRENRLSLPSSTDVVSSFEKAFPAAAPYTQTKAETPVGRIVAGTLEGLPSAYVGPGTKLQKTLSGVFGGAAAESAGEALRGTEAELAGRIGGALTGATVGSTIGSALRARSAPAVAERSERIAGEVLREATPAPQATRQAIERELGEQAIDAERYVPGVRPTTAEIVREPGFSDLERKVSALAPQSSEAAALAQQKEAGRMALGAEASQFPQVISGAIPTTDLAAAFNFPGRNPQNIASQNVRASVDALESSLDAAQKAAWANPLLQKTNYYTGKSVGSISDYIQNLNVTKRGAINPRVMEDLNGYLQSGGKTIPLDALQSIRSSVLDDAREAARKGRMTDWRVNTDLGNHIAKVMNDAKNVQFGDKTGQARKAWNDAVASTKSYYDTFRSDFMSKMVSDTKGGAPTIPGDVVFDTMLSGKNAVQNFDDIYKVMGPSIHSDASTWILGKLTDNGQKLVLDQKTVNKFMSNPTNAAVVGKIPGLQAQIDDLIIKTGESARETTLRNVNSLFQNMAMSDNPAKLSRFLDANGALLKSTLPPDGQKFLDSINRSAKIYDSIKPGAVASDQTLSKLTNNSIGGILYGRAIGRIPDVLGGEIITYLLGKAAGVSAPGAGALLGATGVGRQVTSDLSDKFTRILFGPTKEQTVDLLQRAMRDPELASILMQKPTASNISGVLDGVLKSFEASGRTALRAQPIAAGELERFEQRQGRKAGGRVMSAQHMLAAAERAKKEISGGTQALLKSSDENIAKALEIAKQNLEG